MECFFCGKKTYLYLLKNKVGAEVLSCKTHRDIAVKAGWREVSPTQYALDGYRRWWASRFRWFSNFCKQLVLKIRRK